jgi:transposase
MHGRRVQLRVTVRRFFCDEVGCPRRTFAERFEGVAQAHARKTSRLMEALCEIAFACGGEGGSQLAAVLGMVVSGDTLLRLIRRNPLPAFPAVEVLGVDDWAWRRGHRYGTILCDLPRHRPVDLLPERSAESLSAWLKDRSEVQTISRDRAACYAEGATKGAPEAVQVADRFHLLHNLREAVERLLDRHVGDVTTAARVAAETRGPPGTEEAPVPAPSAPISDASPTTNTAAHERRLARYRQVMDLHAQGVSLREIGRRLGLHRSTVRRFVRAGQFPERATRSYEQLTDRYEAYLRRRWEAGCHNARQLYGEVRAQGYRGSYCVVRRCVAPWREPAEAAHTPGARPAPKRRRSVARLSSKRVTSLLLREPAARSDEEQRFVETLRQRCPKVDRGADLAQAFTSIVRERRAADFDGWIARSREAGCPREMRVFVEGLLKDEAAVRAALSLPWSNGQVEGHVNRLKLIKRMMYGRGGFDLLRRRVLHRPPGCRYATATVTAPSVQGHRLVATAA